LHTSLELHYWAAKINAAGIDLIHAQQATLDDKALRQYSVWARLYDWLFPTQAEKQEATASDLLALTKWQAQQAAFAWIKSSAERNLSLHRADCQRHADQLVRVGRSRKRLEDVKNWYSLSEVAIDKLSRAAADCESASTTELLDLVSTSKAISALSSLEASSAANSVRMANAAVRALAEALPKRTAAYDVAVPDDMLDLVADLVFAPSFDVLSWLNMDKLDDAARECRQLADKLAPTHDRIKSAVEAANARLGGDINALKAIEKPYLTAAAALVPSIIQCKTPETIE